jgi:hypothetical protein
MGSMATAAVEVEPLAGGATSSGATSWFGLLLRWLQRTVASAPADDTTLEAMRTMALALGRPLLEATSRDDLDDRLEQAFQRPEFARANIEATRCVRLDELAEVALPKDPPPALVRVIGATAAKIIAGTGPLVAGLGSVIAQIAAEHGREALSGAAGSSPDVLALPGVHSTIKRALLGGLRSSAAFLGIAAAVFEDRKLEPWLSLALAESYRDGLYQYMRLLASLPVHVPEVLVPAADRLDLAALQRRAREGEAAWEAYAYAYPEGTPPFGPADED